MLPSDALYNDTTNETLSIDDASPEETISNDKTACLLNKPWKVCEMVDWENVLSGRKSLLHMEREVQS